MNPMYGEDEQMEEDPAEADGMDRQSLEELLEWAKGGMRKDMASRYGKPMPGEAPPMEPDGDEMPADGAESADSPVPGAEMGTDAHGEDAEGRGMDAEKLKMLLAHLSKG